MHYEYIRRLQRWRDRQEKYLDSRPRIQSLDLLSHYLTEFQYGKFDDIEVPGQYTEVNRLHPLIFYGTLNCPFRIRTATRISSTFSVLVRSSRIVDPTATVGNDSPSMAMTTRGLLSLCSFHQVVIVVAKSE
jgi:hypothetical protein